jgi:PRTRC genetic system ThiF family protein
MKHNPSPISNLKFPLSNPLLSLHLPDFHRVSLTLAGCGGTGSHLASGLAPLALALHERGIACDLRLVDPDLVESRNIGRQLFAPADLGKPKALVLAARLNAAYGLRIEAVQGKLETVELNTDALDLVIGAVDNLPARAHIEKLVVESEGKLWWMDCGNERETGQVSLGNVPANKLGKPQLGLIDRLPMPSVVYPDLVKSPSPRSRRAGDASNKLPSPTGRRAGDEGSCAIAIASGDQSLVVNRMVAAWALSMLHDFLLMRRLSIFSVAFNLRWGSSSALALDAKTLASFASSSRNGV